MFPRKTFARVVTKARRNKLIKISKNINQEKDVIDGEDIYAYKKNLRPRVNDVARANWMNDFPMTISVTRNDTIFVFDTIEKNHRSFFFWRISIEKRKKPTYQSQLLFRNTIIIEVSLVFFGVHVNRRRAPVVRWNDYYTQRWSQTNNKYLMFQEILEKRGEYHVYDNIAAVLWHDCRLKITTQT